MFESLLIKWRGNIIIEICVPYSDIATLVLLGDLVEVFRCLDAESRIGRGAAFRCYSRKVRPHLGMRLAFVKVASLFCFAVLTQQLAWLTVKRVWNLTTHLFVFRL